MDSTNVFYNDVTTARCIGSRVYGLLLKDGGVGFSVEIFSEIVVQRLLSITNRTRISLKIFVRNFQFEKKKKICCHFF